MNTSRKGFLIWRYVTIFLLISFVVTASFLLFLNSMEIDTSVLKQNALLTFGNIFFLSAFCCLVEWVLRKLTVDGPIRMIRDGQTYRYPGILIYVMALWAFAKIIIAAKNLIQRRRDEQPILAAARTLSFAAALLSILALQAAMITEFGGGADFARTMNTIAGAVIAALLIALSLIMLMKSGSTKISFKKNAHTPFSNKT